MYLMKQFYFAQLMRRVFNEKVKFSYNSYRMIQLKKSFFMQGASQVFSKRDSIGLIIGADYSSITCKTDKLRPILCKIEVQMLLASVNGNHHKSAVMSIIGWTQRLIFFGIFSYIPGRVYCSFEGKDQKLRYTKQDGENGKLAISDK